jgi:hypothetical protein
MSAPERGRGSVRNPVVFSVLMNPEVHDIRLTVLGLPAGQGIFQYADGGPDWGAADSDLPRASVEAHPGDSLKIVLERGAEAMGVSLTPGVRQTRINLGAMADDALRSPAGEAIDMLVFAAFRQEDDDRPLEGVDGVVRRDTQRRKHTVLVVRDAEGRAVWHRPPFDATVGELIDAAEHGLLEGDPLSPYLVLVVPQGDLGILGEWAALQRELETAWQLTGAFAAIAGALSGIDWVKKRLRRGEAAEAVEKNAADWKTRGAAPCDLRVLIAAKPRRTEEIASLFGCSDDEADAILWALGFVPRGPGGTGIAKA